MSSTTWYWAASVGAAACSVLALIVIVAGWRRQLAEVAVVGSSLMAVSLLPLSAGLGGTALFGGPPSSGWAAALALPAAAIASIPLVGSTRMVRWWRKWVVIVAVLATFLAVALVDAASSPPSAVHALLLTIGAAGAALLMRRQWTLYRIGRLRSSLVTLAAVGLIAIAATSNIVAGPGSLVSWASLAAESAGVLAASVAVAWGYRVDRTVADVLARIVAREPLMALEAGLSPEVHAFVAALEAKDSITRDHVVRTSALALRVALRAGLDDERVRDVALGALLHDIGKLVMPSDILNKPGALTDDEFRTIATHPEAGEQLLAGAPSLGAAARFVRWHHERYDGRGYPDGLSGDRIGLDVGIVSVVDAWDAMTNTRQYRDGMSAADAIRILRDGAASQWHPEAVRQLLAELRSHPDGAGVATGSGMGRSTSSSACECLADVLGEATRADAATALEGD